MRREFVHSGSHRCTLKGKMLIAKQEDSQGGIFCEHLAKVADFLRPSFLFCGRLFGNIKANDIGKVPNIVC